MTIEHLISDPSYKEKFVLQKLICYFLDYSKEEMRLHASQELSSEQEQKILTTYRDVVDNNKPLEYALGFVEFFKRKFHVDQHTLIPRPETEYMITAVTEEIDRLQIADGRWQETTCKLQTTDGMQQADTKLGDKGSCNVLLDIGTGCGVLGISVLLQNPCFFKKAIFTDISDKALSVAQQNYEILIRDHDFPVEFIVSDLLSFLDDARHNITGCRVILVGNLPYIPEKTFDENVADNVKKREPKMAFVGGDDGLIYYRNMLDQIIKIADDRQQMAGNGALSSEFLTLFLEMMTRQTDILRQEYQDYFVFEDVKTFHFNIRIVKTTLK